LLTVIVKFGTVLSITFYQGELNTVDTENLVNEINEIIRKGKFDLPNYRKKVTKSGKNVQWLLRNFGVRNQMDTHLKSLLIELAGK